MSENNPIYGVPLSINTRQDGQIDSSVLPAPATAKTGQFLAVIADENGHVTGTVAVDPPTGGTAGRFGGHILGDLMFSYIPNPQGGDENA